MRRFLSKAQIVIFFLFFLFLAKSQVFATAEIRADPFFTDPTTTTIEAIRYIYGKENGIDARIVTENTKTVKIIFTGLSGDTFDICLSTNCFLFANTSKDLKSLVPNASVFDDIKLEENVSIADGIYVCADGKNSLKLANGTDCGEGDYFHGGRVYGVVLANQDGVVDTAAFYVSRYYPKVWLEPGNIKPGERINVHIKGTRRPHDNGKRNNYAIEIARADDPDSIFKQECKTVPDDADANGRIVTFDGRPEGDYLIKINEQAHEGNLFHEGCSAEFTYYWIKFRVRSQDFWSKNCNLAAGVNLCPNSTMEIIPDPNGSDVPGAKRGKKPPLPPCAVSNWNIMTSDTCPRLRTAVGYIDTSPEKFIGSLLGLVLGLSGGLALLLIIYGGYQLMMARGKPETLEAARDQITAAVIGLLFIIFSLVLLQLIGFNILRIPEFGP